MTCCHLGACMLLVSSQSKVMCIDFVCSGGILLVCPCRRTLWHFNFCSCCTGCICVAKARSHAHSCYAQYALQISKAEDFIEQRFVAKAESQKIPHQVEITHFNTDKDSIGEIICVRAQNLKTPAVVMAKHNQGSIKEFFMGSVSKYCTHHCTQPVIVLH